MPQKKITRRRLRRRRRRRKGGERLPQKEIDWGEASLRRACEVWRLGRIETDVVLLALGKLGERRQVEGETCWVIEASLRGVAKMFAVSHETVRTALQRLETRGLAGVGSGRKGTRIVLSLARLFDSPGAPGDALEAADVSEKLPPLPKNCSDAGCQPGVNPVSTSRSVSVKEDLKPSVLSVPVSVSVKASGVPIDAPPNFWRRKDLLPWDRGRLKDDDLVTLELKMLRTLFDEAVRTKKIATSDARSFLAAAYHCATHPGVDGWRAKCFVGRVKSGKFRGLCDDAWQWAQQVLDARQRPEYVAEAAAAVGKSIDHETIEMHEREST